MFNQYPYINVNDLNLDWIIKHFKEFIDSIAELKAWRAVHEPEYEALKQFCDDIAAGRFPPSMYDALRKWFNDNAIELVGEMVKHVYFGLNENGYFMVTIPDAWSALIFKTTEFDYETPLQPEYGHLVLLY